MARKVSITPYSSVVGTSIQVSDERGVVAIIMISVPQPRLDYREIALPLAQEIADALKAPPGSGAEAGGNGG